MVVKLRFVIMVHPSMCMIPEWAHNQQLYGSDIKALVPQEVLHDHHKVVECDLYLR